MVERIEPRVTPPVGGPPALSRVQRSGDKGRRRQQSQPPPDDDAVPTKDDGAPRKGRNIDERC